MKAAGNVSNTAKALPSDGGGTGSNVGVGISVAVNYGENAASALIADTATLTTAHNLDIEASLGQKMATQAKSGSKGSTAVTPVVAVSITANDVDATIGSGSSALSIGGNLTDKATLTDQVSTDAEGDTKSSDTGVGISIAVSVVNDHALADSARDLSATSGTVSFAASNISGSEAVAKASVKGGQQDNNSGSHTDNGSDQSVDNSTNQQSSFADGKAKEKDGSAKGAQGASNNKAKTSDGGVSVAGAVAVAIENGSSQAHVGSVDASGKLSVTSAANVDGHAIADGSASTTSGGTGVGVAVSVNVANVTNQAYIDNGATIRLGSQTSTARVLSTTVRPPSSARMRLAVGSYRSWPNPLASNPRT